VHRKNKSGQGARLSNNWLLGLKATPPWIILTNTSEQELNRTGINTISDLVNID